MLEVFYSACRGEGGTADEIHLRGLRAVLARWGRQPAPVAAGDVGELVAWLQSMAEEVRTEDYATIHSSYLPARAADLLAQRHPAPVPVSERLPGQKDCLDEGWAWFFSPRVGWRQATQPVHSTYTHWLPAHALPVPTPSEND
jgi:hypothetical protein